jgi:hypothetical protein
MGNRPIALLVPVVKELSSYKGRGGNDPSQESEPTEVAVMNQDMAAIHKLEVVVMNTLGRVTKHTQKAMASMTQRIDVPFTDSQEGTSIGTKFILIVGKTLLITTYG